MTEPVRLPVEVRFAQVLQSSTRDFLERTMAMEPPKPKMGVDPVRSRDIMDDIVNVVRTARAFVPHRVPIPRLACPALLPAFKK